MVCVSGSSGLTRQVSLVGGVAELLEYAGYLRFGIFAADADAGEVVGPVSPYKSGVVFKRMADVDFSDHLPGFF